MFCKKCGKYNPDYSKVCMYCGTSLDQGQKDNKSGSFYQGAAWQQPPSQQYSSGESKKVEGVLLCLFLSFIGLIIGLIIYQDPYERSSFINGWLLMFFLALACLIILPIITWLGIGVFSCFN